MLSPLRRRSGWAYSSLWFTQPFQALPKVGSACALSFSRIDQSSLALRPAHFTLSPIRHANRRLQPFHYLRDCSDCFRLARLPGWSSRPLESAAFAWRTPTEGPLGATGPICGSRHLSEGPPECRIVSVATIIAVGVNNDGRREILGLDIGPSETEIFWTEFLRKLRRRGLGGVKLAVSDVHEGIKAAVSMTASRQRCRVHFMRNTLVIQARAGGGWSPPFIATAFAQDDAEAASCNGAKSPTSCDPRSQNSPG